MILRSGWSDTLRPACVMDSAVDIAQDLAEPAELQAPGTTSSFSVSYLNTKAK